MNIVYIPVLLITITLSAALSLAVRRLALKFRIVDKPGLWRKIHKKSVPLMGGVAVFLSFFTILFIVRDKITAGNLELSHWIGFFIGGLILIIGGFLDDKYKLKPAHQIIFPILAAVAVIVGGVNVEKITNPFGGFVYLDVWYLSGTLIFIWLMGMMYTTKLLDGIDGLVSGITAIGALTIFVFTMTTKFYQPDIGLAALVLAGAALGFLLFNWHPAKIFLGEGGSLFLGFALGVLAIISGGKIAIALLVMGIPIMDVAWTIVRRLRSGHHPFKFSDRKHLHYRLLDLGLSQRQTALVYYALATLFGLSAVFLQSLGKVLALGVLMTVMLVIIVSFSFLENKKNNK